MDDQTTPSDINPEDDAFLEHDADLLANLAAFESEMFSETTEEGPDDVWAALDVLEAEPPAEDDPIVTLPNVICFPHIGTATNETRRLMRELAVTNLLAVLQGERPPAPVNPKVLG